jgi:hypothetical protein
LKNIFRKLFESKIEIWGRRRKHGEKRKIPKERIKLKKDEKYLVRHNTKYGMLGAHTTSKKFKKEQ